MPEKPVPLTRTGLEKLQQELEQLRTTRRQEVADALHRTKDTAAAEYDAEYDDAKKEQAFVEGRIFTLEGMLRNATLIDEEEARRASRIQIGSHVRILAADGAEHRYVIVGPAEADPGNGRISNESPVGRALVGKRVGDEAEVLAPAGVVRLMIRAIE